MDHAIQAVDGRCSVCDKPVHAFRGSLRHRWREPEDATVRFWRFVRKGDGCWEWTGGRTAAGWHGRFAVKATRPAVIVMAHRFSWELHYGPIPDGMEVCHHCDNPPCGRPDHLFLGTHADNMRDAGNKGRTGPQIRDWSRCKRGHLIAETAYVETNGRRRCRVCVRDRQKRRYAELTPEQRFEQRQRWPRKPLTPEQRARRTEQQRGYRAMYRDIIGQTPESLRAAAETLEGAMG
jgi:hypothetical protein